ncbi:MAG: multicopper oxidase domain-containing protein [Thaumarchaeota archaeon]|nr:multicopper oxidase domain-containing protein [Nitrososphaerota archaeon]
MQSAYTVATLAFVIGVAWVGWIAYSLVFPAEGQVLTATPTVEFAIDGGEAGPKFGFAFEGQQISSPGPTLTVKTGDIVKVNFKNNGATAHAFSVVKENSDEAPIMFKATIGTGPRPLVPGDRGSIVFNADTTGTYYYICPVPGHAQLGMWGEFKVEG